MFRTFESLLSFAMRTALLGHRSWCLGHRSWCLGHRSRSGLGHLPACRGVLLHVVWLALRLHCRHHKRVHCLRSSHQSHLRNRHRIHLLSLWPSSKLRNSSSSPRASSSIPAVPPVLPTLKKSSSSESSRSFTLSPVLRTADLRADFLLPERLRLELSETAYRARTSEVVNSREVARRQLAEF